MAFKDIQVTKRNGKAEPFNADKINRVLQWAVDGIKDVSFEEVAMNANLQFYNGITSKDIHLMLIEAAANLISEAKPNYQFVAGRLLNYQLRKAVWGGKNPPKLLDFVKRNVNDTKVYDPDILTWYTPHEFDKLDEYLKHERDLTFAYAGIKQLCDKYLVQHRGTKEIYETPQFAYMLIAMTLFKGYGDHRTDYIKRAYTYFSRHKINLPTPIMAGVRTTIKSYASCALLSVADDLDSIFANNSAIGKATAWRYGVGINASRIRATNAPIRNGDTIHTGVVSFLKVFEATTKSCQKGGLRGGGGTVNFSYFHWDIEDVLSLKNNAKSDDQSVKRLDYCIAFDRLFYERFLKDEHITLFSYHEAPELWDHFGMPTFRDLYEKAERKHLKFKRQVKARDLMMLFSKERIETGRMYVMNIDHVNEHGSWCKQVDTTNLCVEVNHPLKPIYDLHDPNGEIGVCILAAINLLEIKDEDEMKSVADVIVRMLDALIDHQSYFVPAAANFATKRRSLGVGVTNLAALLAREGVKYEDKKAPNVAARWMEQVSYHLIKASVQLAREKGKCDLFDETKFSQGLLPIDTYKRDIDEFVTEKLHMDWEGLRTEIKEHGMRNSTLTAIMPVESSSVIQSSTNGIEPPRSLISQKRSKVGVIPTVVPHIATLGKSYTLAFDMSSNEGYLRVAAAIQKFTDMSMSTNLYYNVNHYPDKQIPQEELIRDIMLAYRWGIKALYYSNTYDGDTHSIESEAVAGSTTEASCAGGACTL